LLTREKSNGFSLSSIALQLSNMKKKLLPNILLALCLGLILNYIFLGQMNWKNDTLCQEIASMPISDGCRALEYGFPLKWLTSTAELSETNGINSVIQFNKTNLSLNVLFFSCLSSLVLLVFQKLIEKNASTGRSAKRRRRRI